MKAAILAAGVGSRLRPITSTKPKCLVKIAGRSILEYQIEAYRQAGIREVFIVAGYEYQKIGDFCKHLKGVNVTIVNNEDYEVTNNMYSVYLLREWLEGHAFILSNGDVAIDPLIVKGLAENNVENAVPVDRGCYNDESMKISLDGDGFINDISKSIPESSALGCSIDFYKFSSEASKVFFDEIRYIIDVKSSYKEWTEVALQDLFKKKKLLFKPYDISGKRWVEVDNYDDLAVGDKLFSEFDISLQKQQLFFIDLDGTIYLGNELIKGASSFIEMLKDKKKEFYYLSNNSSKSKDEYVKKLRSLGISCSHEQIILSTDGLVHFLEKENSKKVFILGTRALEKTVMKHGIEIDDDSPEYIIVGYDTELTYQKLKKAAILLLKGIDMLATHRDKVCPTEEGPIPDVGSMLALLKEATGKSPVRIFGKPNPEMVRHIIDKRNVALSQVVIIGDRLYTDMELARRIGCNSILVLSGDTKRGELEDAPYQPTLVVRNLNSLC
ncbi:MAG: HAD-IIA family hydrolase [Deltaproteobacteria bacterium]|nr:HAD-IIA family hydrolase [Deltaproteobacteria bacterium]